MNSQELRNLQEAYIDVYQELDEGETPLPYGRMMKKSDELASTDDKTKRKRAAKIYIAANAPTGTKIKVKEQVDLYDIILSHLLDEGYAETQEQAEVIMVNMSEDWRESICEEYKKLPVDRMAKQAEHKAFQNNFDVGGAYHYYDTNKKLKKMSEIGGEKVEKSISRGRVNATKFRNRLKDSVKL
jgi:hypothetical protein